MKIKGPMLAIAASVLLLGMLASSAHAIPISRDVYWSLTDPGLWDPGGGGSGSPWTLWPKTGDDKVWLPTTGSPATVSLPTTVWVGVDNEEVAGQWKWANFGFKWDYGVNPGTSPTPGWKDGAVTILDVGGYIADPLGTYKRHPAMTWRLDSTDHVVDIVAVFSKPQPQWEFAKIRVNSVAGFSDIRFLDKPFAESECFVPEPASMSLLALALVGGFAGLRKRRR